MTVLKGPCMSLRARGTFHEILTFSGCRSSHVAKRRNRKSNPNTIPQRGHRSMLAYLAADWTRLIPPATASWVNSATAADFSAYHWFMKFNLARWKLGKGPSWWFGNQDTGAAPSVASWSLTNHKNFIRLIWPAAGYSGVRYAIWHKGAGIGFAPTPATAITVDRWMDVRDHLIVDRPTKPGLHYYRLQVYSATGVGLIHADTNSITVS